MRVTSTRRNSYAHALRRSGRIGMAALKTPELSLPIVVLILCIYFATQSDVFLTGTNFQNIGKQSSALAILVFGQALVVISGGFDLSVGSTVGLSSVLGSLVWRDESVALGMLTFLGVGLVVGVANGTLIAGFRLSPLIVTLGMLSICRALALIISGGLPVAPMPQGFRWLGTASAGPVPIPGLIAIGAIVLLYVLLRLTPFGVHLYAIGGNARAARLSGINVMRGSFLVYVLNGLLASLAGAILSARVNSGQPLLGTGLELEVLAAVFLGGVALTGGVGSLTGVFFGLVLIVILGNGLNLTNVSSFWQQLITGAILVFAIALNRVLRTRGADD